MPTISHLDPFGYQAGSLRYPCESGTTAGGAQMTRSDNGNGRTPSIFLCVCVFCSSWSKKESTLSLSLCRQALWVHSKWTSELYRCLSYYKFHHVTSKGFLFPTGLHRRRRRLIETTGTPVSPVPSIALL